MATAGDRLLLRVVSTLWQRISARRPERGDSLCRWLTGFQKATSSRFAWSPTTSPNGCAKTACSTRLLALNARVRNLAQEHLARAVAEEKSLLQSWCMRGSPYYFPASDAPVFTTGVLPPTDEAMRHFMLGVKPAVDRLDLSLTETVELTGAKIGDVLSGRQLAINELGAEIAERIAREMPKKQRESLQNEAEQVAPLRGASSVDVEFDTY